MPKDQTKKFELGVIEVGTVVLDVSPPAATYTSAKTVYWNSSGIQWKFHSSQDPLEWSGSDPHSTPLYPESTLNADGSASDEVLLERYMDDLYTKAGCAAQKMPRLNDLLVKFKHGHELSFGYSKGEWSLDIMKRRCDTYVPSSRILEAWKVPGGQLEYCPGLLTLEAIYTSWPPV
jgi:hypothetical protein